MAKKDKRPTSARDCKCDLCETQAHAVPGKPHRRCPGTSGAPLRAKHSGMGAKRGTWA